MPLVVTLRLKRVLLRFAVHPYPTTLYYTAVSREKKTKAAGVLLSCSPKQQEKRKYSSIQVCQPVWIRALSPIPATLDASVALRSMYRISCNTVRPKLNGAMHPKVWSYMVCIWRTSGCFTKFPAEVPLKLFFMVELALLPIVRSGFLGTGDPATVAANRFIKRRATESGKVCA